MTSIIDLYSLMKLFVLTPIYATSTSMQGATPVVHYFTREWAKMGHDVTVFHFEAKFPLPMYWVGRHFQHQINTRLGMLVPVEKPFDDDYEVEGVLVHRRCLKKYVPHSCYSPNQLRYAIDIVKKEIELYGEPDWFIGHWDNPQLELLNSLKKIYKIPACIVLHDNRFNYERKYGSRCLEMLKFLDIIGFRNQAALHRYNEVYGMPKRSFIASSGVSKIFLMAGEQLRRKVKHPVRNFVFVGSLIERKFPVAIIKALSKVYNDGNFEMTYIGDGAEKIAIVEEHSRLGNLGKVRFTGRIPREKIVHYMKQSDVFVMISKGEIFGLVYLEAMALGLITVGSKNEGIDGVIRDGENGFLCEAGNVNELAKVLERIKKMSTFQLEEMSIKAKETAKDYSDEGVAKKYIEVLKTTF